MDIKQEVNSIAKELLEIIASHLEQNKIEMADAQKLAKEFLTILPVADQQDLLNKLKGLGEKFEEIQEVYVDELAKVSDAQRDNVLNQMQEAIRKGNIDEAISVAKSMKGAE